MQNEVITLTRELVAIPSETTNSNVAIIDFLQSWLESRDFSLERVSYLDANEEEKINLIAKRGEGKGGLGFFSHSDTVPYGTEAGWYQQFTRPVILGPGCIAQAHTHGEWIDTKQLQDAVGVYEKMIEQLCM